MVIFRLNRSRHPPLFTCGFFFEWQGWWWKIIIIIIIILYGGGGDGNGGGGGVGSCVGASGLNSSPNGLVQSNSSIA